MSDAPKRYDAPPRLPAEGPVDVRAFLSAAASDPIELEIGPGRGGFMLERLATAPEVRMLGLEIRRKWATLVDERLAREGLRGRVVCEDARLALPRLEPDASVQRVFVHFPDPWWKKRHHKRLVLVDPLVAQIARLLCDGGELFLQTDVPERADEYEARIAAHEALLPHGDAPGSPRLAANPYGARGNRERRADADGLPVYRLRYRRKSRRNTV